MKWGAVKLTVRTMCTGGTMRQIRPALAKYVDPLPFKDPKQFSFCPFILKPETELFPSFPRKEYLSMGGGNGCHSIVFKFKNPYSHVSRTNPFIHNGLGSVSPREDSLLFSSIYIYTDVNIILMTLPTHPNVSYQYNNPPPLFFVCVCVFFLESSSFLSLPSSQFCDSYLVFNPQE